jgi:hypothetical protein
MPFSQNDSGIHPSVSVFEMEGSIVRHGVASFTEALRDFCRCDVSAILPLALILTFKSRSYSVGGRQRIMTPLLIADSEIQK